MLAILCLQGAETGHWLIAVVETHVAPGMELDGLAATEVLQVINGYVLVRMLDGESAESSLLVSCEIRFGEGAIPTKIGIKARDQKCLKKRL